MDEAAAAARDGAGGGMAGADALPSAAPDTTADNASTMATVGTGPVTAPWQPDDAAGETAFAADVDIGMPESDLSPAAGKTPVAAPAVAPVPAGPARAKGPSRRPTSTQPAPYHDALTSYRELYDKAKCGLACRRTLLPHLHTTVAAAACLNNADLQTPTGLLPKTIKPLLLCCVHRLHCAVAAAGMPAAWTTASPRV